MRSLIIRFMDAEGPGIIEDCLLEKNSRITYHDSYKKGIELIPSSHLLFDVIVLMGGPQSVYDPDLDKFFKPYFQLIENTLAQPGKKVIGVCLGSQILAKVLGARVFRGEAGEEVGFDDLTIQNKSHPVFEGIGGNTVKAFHLHGDTFNLPAGSELLLSSSKYENQMYSYENRAFGIQCHLEITLAMLSVWWDVHKTIPNTLGKMNNEVKFTQQDMEVTSRVLFKNLLK